MPLRNCHHIADNLLRQAESNCPFCHQMRYWVLGLIPSPGTALPGEVDRCLTGSRHLDTPEFEKVSTQEERKTFVEKLDEACIIYLLNSMCKIGFTWTEKIVTNLGEVPLRSKKKIVSDKLYRALYSKILLPYHEFFQGKLNFKASVFLCFHHITLILVHQCAIITLGIWRSHDRTPREIPVASTDEINTVSEEAGGVTAELGVAANANYCINQSDT
ncbi:hypothetical protein DY000_02040501 [Brassica cretica]|uniref:Uncharacterized protein n=1 Tax=Brassica cretica TaxID=69181 RepID=A0ABQ7BEW9_BRACR|nr:hypothetical protein DY000_02040501 [Brassica cretica]